MSVFHHVRNIGAMRSVTFLRLANRLAAYNGAVAARIAAERRERAPEPAGRRRTRTVTTPRYERNSGMTNNARIAVSAPPATAGALAAVNAQLGGGWISHRTVKTDV
jgi:hypothetical protein